MNSKNNEIICSSDPVVLCESKNEENEMIKCDETKDFSKKLNDKPNPKKGGDGFYKCCFHGCT